MKEHTGNFRGFSILSQAYYSTSALNEPDISDEIMIGLYHPEGGTSGEFAIRWVTGLRGGKAVPRLEAFDDSWSALTQFHDLLAAMAEIDNQDTTPEAFAEILKNLGIVDRTLRTR